MHATGGTAPFGIEGWRFAFLSVALVSIAIGIGNFMFAHDPRFPPGQDKVPLKQEVKQTSLSVAVHGQRRMR